LVLFVAAMGVELAVHVGYDLIVAPFHKADERDDSHVSGDQQ